MSSQEHVVVAMSGGVDSSVAAALLVQQGYQVTGMMLRLWSEPGRETSNRCCTPDAMYFAKRVAARLNIPFYALDARQVFRDTVVENFINGYAQFTTPNPCLVCNQQIRWGFLLQQAMTSGADFFATGHYARINRDSSGHWQLLRAIDHDKDQSYVLHRLDQSQLAQTLFPLGNLTKPQVRQLARDFQLPVAERSESQDLCFLGSEDYRDFLARHAPALVNPGPIFDRQGKQIGEHPGLAFFTIGQRKGIHVASPIPLYVMSKEPARNALIVSPLEALGQDELSAESVHWISGQPPDGPFSADVKIRYKAKEVRGMITPMPNQEVHVKFEHQLRDCTPGQAVVFYEDQNCLGGGIIRAQ